MIDSHNKENLQFNVNYLAYHHLQYHRGNSLVIDDGTVTDKFYLKFINNIIIIVIIVIINIIVIIFISPSSIVLQRPNFIFCEW